MKQDENQKKENLIKKLISNKIFLSLLFFTLGILADWSLNRYRAATITQSRSIFEAFNELNRPSLDWPQLSQTTVADVKLREDDQYIYYDIGLEKSEPQKINVQVNGHQISISGQIEHREEKEGLNSYSSSSFHKSFPVPDNVDPNTYKMENEKGKIILKFKKTINS